jgi:hypothetical protein
MTTMPPELKAIANRFHNAHADAATALARAEQRWTERDPQLAESTEASRAKADALYDELTKPKHRAAAEDDTDYFEDFSVLKRPADPSEQAVFPPEAAPTGHSRNRADGNTNSGPHAAAREEEPWFDEDPLGRRRT